MAANRRSIVRLVYCTRQKSGGCVRRVYLTCQKVVRRVRSVHFTSKNLVCVWTCVGVAIGTY